MKIRFHLTRPNAKNDTSIFARISSHQKRIKFYTGISVNPVKWKQQEQKAVANTSYRQGSSINTRLNKIKSIIEKSYYDFVEDNDKEPSLSTLKKIIDRKLGRSKNTKLSFYEFWDDFIHRTNTGQRFIKSGKRAGQPIKPSKAYKVTLNNLKQFDSRLSYDDIDLDFHKKYIQFLQRKGLSTNTIGRDIQNIKAVMNEAVEYEHTDNTKFRSDNFSKPREEVQNIALTESELKELASLNLSNRPYLENTRDLFLIACHTGLRYSDVSRLSTKDIKGGFIEITQTKTGNPVVIPVHDVVKNIIIKYKGDLPKAVSQQKFNSGLKTICKQVPVLCENFSKTGTKGGMKTTINYKKWEKITSHTARRTFATNEYLKGTATLDIMAVTGHKTEQNFLKYIKVNPKQHAKRMAANWSRNKMKIVK